MAYFYGWGSTVLRLQRQYYTAKNCVDRTWSAINIYWEEILGNSLSVIQFNGSCINKLNFGLLS